MYSGFVSYIDQAIGVSGCPDQEARARSVAETSPFQTEGRYRTMRPPKQWRVHNIKLLISEDLLLDYR
ncbi:hypothetical protein MP228_008829 [Amoeboaphelidium protococcarum]|nr:hypothetical protein MP228_008829 [Amoeboaphelidium protococcarum]